MIKYIEYIETDGSPITYVLTHGGLTTVDDVIYFDFMPLAGTARYDGWYNFAGENYMFSVGTYGGGYNLNGMNIGFGSNGGYGSTTRPTLTFNTKYECILDKASFTANNTAFPFSQTATTIGSATQCRLNGTLKADNVTPDRCSIARYYGFKIVSNGTTVCDYRPVLDDNDNPCFYDEVSHTFEYHYGTGTPIAGPVLHVFGPSKTYCRFYASGGTDTFDVEAETTWTASTPTFVSLSPSTGASGTTTVTVTCPSWTGETRREEIITFTDADDWTFDVKMRQRANTQVFSNIYLGDNQVLTMYIGDNNVSTIYLGDNDVFSS